jgi:hypothetical protein
VVLVDRARLQCDFLPLEPEDPGDRWEQAMTTTAARRGMQRYTLMDEQSWVLHPLTHGPRYVHVLPDLVWAVEHGVYPFRRSGYRWDVRVDGMHALPWIAAARLARGARAFGRNSLGGTQRYGGVGA